MVATLFFSLSKSEIHHPYSSREITGSAEEASSPVTLEKISSKSIVLFSDPPVKISACPQSSVVIFSSAFGNSGIFLSE